jgi:Zn-dependent protease with chaperone function
MLAFGFLAAASVPSLANNAATSRATSAQSRLSSLAFVQAKKSSVPSANHAEETQKLVASYTLPPEKYSKARHLSQVNFVIRFFSPIYQIVLLALLLRLGLSSKFRDWAEAASSQWILQSAIYASIFFLAFALPQLPIDTMEHWLLRRYGLVVQGWGSWLWDQAKAQVVFTIVGIVAVAGLFGALRKSPRHWWLYFWLGAIPVTIVLVFISPYVIDPLFHQFEPLQQHDPALVDSLERLVSRAGLTIPPDRMFWMKASEKMNLLNAYVTGIGSSKRIVVWDTTIEKMTNGQILFVVGHEMGHYVLEHIPKGLILFAAFLLVLFYIGGRVANRMLRREIDARRIRGPDDWAALPVYGAILLFLLFLATPITNAVSRHFEHQADQYGLEITHGITPDSGEVAAQSFQVLGEVDMEDPAPNRLEIWWFWDHPWIGDRIRFALEYDPWSKSESPEFVK